MTSGTEREIRATHERYLDTRRRIEAGELGWDARVHVNELIRESGWRPSASFHMPPKHPRR